MVFSISFLGDDDSKVLMRYTRIKPHLELRYKLLICTIYVFMNACFKIDIISNLCERLFGQQLTEYPS